MYIHTELNKHTRPYQCWLNWEILGVGRQWLLVVCIPMALHLNEIFGSCRGQCVICGRCPWSVWEAEKMSW